MKAASIDGPFGLLAACPMLHSAQSLSAQCIVIGPVCGRVCSWRAGWRVGGVCYHDNSKLRASIFTKLDLQVQVVTVSSWLNFGHPAPPPAKEVCGGAKFFDSALLRPARSVCVSLSAFSFNIKCYIVNLFWGQIKRSLARLLYSSSGCTGFHGNKSRVISHVVYGLRRRLWPTKQ